MKIMNILTKILIIFVIITSLNITLVKGDDIESNQIYFPVQGRWQIFRLPKPWVKKYGEARGIIAAYIALMPPHLKDIFDSSAPCEAPSNIIFVTEDRNNEIKSVYLSSGKNDCLDDKTLWGNFTVLEGLTVGVLKNGTIEIKKHFRKEAFMAPGEFEGKELVFPIKLENEIRIRSTKYTIEELFQNSQQSEQSDNEFSKNNPYYKERAGAFYDIEYVSGSAKALFKIADVRPEQMRETLSILRAFVDDWLDAYVRGNGSITEDEVLHCIRTMDLRFHELFNELQQKQYQIWRDDNTGKYNKLHFLMNRW